MAIDVQLLKESFEAIKPVATRVVDHFYDHLFGAHPEAQSLFRPDRMPRQKQALIASLVKIMENLENPEVLTQYLSDMGARHVRYGTQDAHYDWVAESLLATLKYFFDTSWTPDLENAWMAALGLIAETMRAGARQVQVKDEKDAEEGIKREIEGSLRELMRASISELVREPSLKELAAAKAEALIREALQEQMSRLKGKFKTEQAA